MEVWILQVRYLGKKSVQPYGELAIPELHLLENRLLFITQSFVLWVYDFLSPSANPRCGQN